MIYILIHLIEIMYLMNTFFFFNRNERQKNIFTILLLIFINVNKDLLSY